MYPLISLLAGYWNTPEITTNFVIFLNLIGALLLGLLVGYERSYRGRAAGMRTYGLVCMASCALTVITGYPEYWYGGHAPALVNAIDPGRVIQGITTGIGFLGAGVIMRDGLNISGLTTAASIWSVAAIGVLVGVGFYAAAISLTILSGAFMMWGSKIDGFLPSRHAVSVVLHFRKNVVPTEEDLRQTINEQGYEIAKGSFAINNRSEQHEWRFVVVSMGREKGASLVNLGNMLSTISDIEGFNLTHARN
jgi:putative Mg2+ transporter-C (MgtC) family protein